MAGIEFPPDERPDSTRGHMQFSAVVEGKQIACAVAFRTLIVPFRGDLYDPEGTFKANRPRIEQIVTSKIALALFEPDGTIMLRHEDFSPR